MILHLLTSRFMAAYVVDQFERTHVGRNRYFFIASSETERDNLPPELDIHFILRDSAGYFELIKKLDRYDALIVHSLHSSLFPFVLEAPSRMPVAWVFFGTEIYNTLRQFKYSVLLPETKRYLFHSREYFMERIKPFYRKLKGKKTNEAIVEECLKRVDYFLATQGKTHQFLREKGMTDARFLEFIYYSIEESIGKYLMDKRVEGDSILMGNSASISNNHLDTLTFLSKNGIKNKTMYVPLSYGDLRLARRVRKKGSMLFGALFIPLTDFLPREEYNRILLKCGFVIMNHLRPQARGNIITALWMGARVFLNKENILYQEFTEKGIHVSLLSDIEEQGEKAFVRLSDEQVEHNRKVLSAQYAHREVLKRARTLVQELDP